MARSSTRQRLAGFTFPQRAASGSIKAAVETLTRY